MSLEAKKEEMIEEIKYLARVAVNGIGLGSTQDQLTASALMQLENYKFISKIYKEVFGTEPALSDEAIRHMKIAESFKAIKESSNKVKTDIRKAKTEDELEHIKIEDLQK